MPLRKILKIRFQEIEFGGISASKITSNKLTEICSKFHMLMQSEPSHNCFKWTVLLNWCLYLVSLQVQLQSLQYNSWFLLDSNSFQFRNLFLTSLLMECSLYMWSCVCSCKRLTIPVTLILVDDGSKASYSKIEEARQLS